MNKEPEYMKFGTYPQGINGELRPIEWIVLESKGKNKKKSKSLLLLSKHALWYSGYHEDRFQTTWEKCSLRKWLNAEFLEQAFSAKEQEIIVTSNVPNDDNVWCGYSNGYQPVLVADGGEDTRDKVFLLSLDEANRYLGADPEDTEFEKRYKLPACFPTEYVADRWGDSLNDDGTCNWWLRTLGYSGRAVCVEQVNDDTYIPKRSGTEYTWGCFIRPAIWILAE